MRRFANSRASESQRREVIVPPYRSLGLYGNGAKASLFSSFCPSIRSAAFYASTLLLSPITCASPAIRHRVARIACLGWRTRRPRRNSPYRAKNAGNRKIELYIQMNGRQKASVDYLMATLRLNVGSRDKGRLFHAGRTSPALNVYKLLAFLARSQLKRAYNGPRRRTRPEAAHVSAERAGCTFYIPGNILNEAIPAIGCVISRIHG